MDLCTNGKNVAKDTQYVAACKRMRCVVIDMENHIIEGSPMK